MRKECRRTGRHCRQEQPEAVKETLVGPLLNGLASHHAGLLPGWKSLVESLFQQGALLASPCYLVQAEWSVTCNISWESFDTH